MTKLASRSCCVGGRGRRFSDIVIAVNATLSILLIVWTILVVSGTKPNAFVARSLPSRRSPLYSPLFTQHIENASELLFHLYSNDTSYTRDPPLPNGGMKIGIVIPCYNSGGIILETIASFFMQTIPFHKLVVVDDGSNDPITLDALEFAQKKWDKIEVLHVPNAGPSLARERGWRHLKDEVDAVFLIDGDDLVHPATLELFAAALNRKPDAAYVFPDVLFFGDEELVWVAAPFATSHLLFLNIPSSSSMIRSSALEAVNGFVHSKDAIEDWALWTTLAYHNFTPVHVKLPLMAYRRHGKTRSYTYAEDWFRSIGATVDFSPAPFLPHYIEQSVGTWRPYGTVIILPGLGQAETLHSLEALGEYKSLQVIALNKTEAFSSAIHQRRSFSVIVIPAGFRVHPTQLTTALAASFIHYRVKGTESRMVMAFPHSTADARLMKMGAKKGRFPMKAVARDDEHRYMYSFSIFEDLDQCAYTTRNGVPSRKSCSRPHWLTFRDYVTEVLRHFEWTGVPFASEAVSSHSPSRVRTSQDDLLHRPLPALPAVSMKDEPSFQARTSSIASIIRKRMEERNVYMNLGSIIFYPPPFLSRYWGSLDSEKKNSSVILYLMSDTGRGGAKALDLHVLKEMKERGATVILILEEGGSTQEWEDSYMQVCDEFIYLPWLSFDGIVGPAVSPLALDFAKYVVESRSVDIVFVRNSYLGYHLAEVFANRSEVRFIDFFPFSYPDSGWVNMSLSFQQYFHMHLTVADAVFEALRAGAEEYQSSSDRIVLLSHDSSIEVERRNNLTKLVPSPSASGTQKAIAVAGWLSADSVAVCEEALKLDPDLSFVIIGSKPPNSGLVGDHIKYSPGVESPLLYSYLKSFDVLLIPSMPDNIPLAVIEALAAHTRVVSPRPSGDGANMTRSIDGECGITYFPPTSSPVKMAQALISAVGQPFDWRSADDCLNKYGIQSVRPSVWGAVESMLESITITLRQRWRDSLVRMKVHPPSSLPLFVDLLPRYAPDY